jgi:phosphonopyruvate decarboxylase
MTIVEQLNVFYADFCAYITKNVPSSQHMITANEGSAVGLACGAYMASGKPSLVYLQVGRMSIDVVMNMRTLSRILVWAILSIRLCRWQRRVFTVCQCCS